MYLPFYKTPGGFFSGRKLVLGILAALLSAYQLYAAAPLSQTAADSMGLKDRYFLYSVNRGYAFENPSYGTFFSSEIFAEYSADYLYGGLSFGGNANVFTVFSGLPAENEILNTAVAPYGIYHTGGTSYHPLVNTGTGEDLDAAATSSLSPGTFGNLDARVNKLDEATANSLEHHNLGFMYSTGSASAGFGLMAAYAESRDTNEYLGYTTEKLQLKKSQITTALGFRSTPGGVFRVFDGSFGLKLFKVDNSFEAGADSGEKVQGSFESAGAFDFNASLRAGIGQSDALWLLYVSYSLFDTSSLAQAKSSGGIFDLSANSSLNFDRRDTYSRNGYKLKAGISRQQSIGNYAVFLTGVSADFVFARLEYDGKNNKTGEYNTTPLSSEYSSFSIPLIAGMRAETGKSFSFSFALEHLVKQSPASGYNSTTNEKVRSDATIYTVDSFETFTETENHTSVTSALVGISYRQAGIIADWFSDIELFRSGPYFLSGQSRQFSTGFAVRYRYDDWVKTLLKEQKEKDRELQKAENSAQEGENE